jgi:phosphoesterase RecJ-like protein
MLDDKFSSQTDLLIFLDCADYKRGDFDNKVYNLIDIVPSILIDHHPRGDLSRFVEYKIQDPQAASTTELIFCLLEFLGAHIDKRIATALLTGIITDTNSFLNPNTTDKTFVVAARLLSYGARIERVVANLFYQKSCAALKLWGRALSRLQYNQGHDLLLSYLTENDLRECNVSVQEAEGIVNFLNLNAAHKAKAVLFLIENQGKIKGSFRTTAHNIDVSEMARQFGGGGHKKAAGFEIEGSLVLKEGELVM